MNLDQYKKDFARLLDISERQEKAAIKRFYIQEYNKGVEDFITTGKTNGFDGIFKKPDLERLYIDLYTNVGMRFAKWYRDKAVGYIKKENDTSGYNSVWQEHFAAFGKVTAGTKISIVQGTAKGQLVKIIRRLTKDPAFMGAGAVEQGQILRSQFRSLSDMQAERIVRTENTNIANYSSMKAASDIYGEDNLIKQWSSALDSRVRDKHIAVDGQVRPFKEPFLVGGDKMMRPADSSLGARADNVVNCRCAVITLPKENAQPVQDISDIGFGLSSGTTARIGFNTVEDNTRTVERVMEQLNPSTLDKIVISNLKDGKEKIQSILVNEGIAVKKVMTSSSMDLPFFQNQINVLKSLVDRYNIKTPKNTSERWGVSLRFKSTLKTLGNVVRYADKNTSLARINLGDRTVRLGTATREVSSVKLAKRSNAVVDDVNIDSYVTTHEFAHILADSGNLLDKAFFNDLKLIRSEYRRLLQQYVNAGDFTAANKIYLGSYANLNIDEFLAEAFTEYELSSTPSKFALLVGELVEKYFKK